jgi:hypothetical protein
LDQEGGGLMRESVFAGRRLRASYRGFSCDYVLALLEAAGDQDDSSLDSCLHRQPRRLRSHMKYEEQ